MPRSRWDVVHSAVRVRPENIVTDHSDKPVSRPIRTDIFSAWRHNLDRSGIVIDGSDFVVLESVDASAVFSTPIDMKNEQSTQCPSADTNDVAASDSGLPRNRGYGMLRRYYWEYQRAFVP